MANQLTELLNRSQRKKRLIIGLMSGTSLDGLDIALCSFEESGLNTKVKLLNFKTAVYQSDFKQKIKKVFAKELVSLQLVCLLNEAIAIEHARLVNEALAAWGYINDDIDFIASHGQTIYHAPKHQHQLADYPNGTLQIGDGDHLAVNTGIITLSDFRQKHLAGGGEGAPLAVYGDYLLFSAAAENRVMLNIGGISNFTFLPASQDASAVYSTDIGPGNTLMDQYVQENYNGLYFDENATIAKRGKCNQQFLNQLLSHSFFEAPFPKTTGPELFNLEYVINAQQLSATLNLAKEDVLATLCHFTAQAITKAIKSVGDLALKVLMSGGGMHNPLLVSLLKAALPKVKFSTTEELGIDPDAKEAILFAILANETLSGSAINFGERKGVPSICMGKISLPR